MRKRYREGQDDQLSTLGFIVNGFVLWNPRYINAVPGQPRTQGVYIAQEDIVRLSPLGRKHVNLLGRYNLSLPEPVQNGGLRPLNS